MSNLSPAPRRFPSGTEVLGTISGVSDQVILMSGEVDLTSMGGDCGAGSPGGDMFTIGQSGNLQSNVESQSGAPSSCSRSLVRAGFGVQVGAAGTMSSPGRVAAGDVDEVIDAVTVKAETAPAVPLISMPYLFPGPVKARRHWRMPTNPARPPGFPSLTAS